MPSRRPSLSLNMACLVCLVVLLPALFSSSALAQSSIQLFGPVNVRLSASGTGFGPNAVNFNSSTLNLTCSATPITAVLSSTPDGAGNLLVDNNINVSVTAGGTTTGPTNICVGGINGSPQGGSFANCFGTGYETAASVGGLTGQDPDNFVLTDGIPPIPIGQLLSPGPIQVTVALQDEDSGPGFYLANSTLYLDTNCTQSGVTGPSLQTGNPIPSGTTNPDVLDQDFNFNPTSGQQIGFEYDLTTAAGAGGLTITDGTIPEVTDSPIDPSTFQSIYLPQTSFATANCLVHSGEELGNGNPACKLFTLLCTVGTGATATGAQCPVSAQNDEILKDVFSGPAFTLSDIPTPGGPTFHEGIGFLMASDGWTGGPCTYEAAADLANLPCPQNLLTSFTSTTSPSAPGPLVRAQSGVESSKLLRAHPDAANASTSGGTDVSSGRTTHPNSTFITVVQVPEDLTTVTVAGQHPGNWINSSTAHVTLSSQPPSLAGTALPGAAAFVASPIENITYGISPAGSVPPAGAPVPTDKTLLSSVVCPTLANPTGIPATTFTPPAVTLTGLAEGYYLLHYYAQDCAGTEELQFTQDTSGDWSTSFYTFPINVDKTPPVVNPISFFVTGTSNPGPFTVGQSVTADYSCTDALSGIVACGSHTYAPGALNTTPTLTSKVGTSTPGMKQFVVTAKDAAGNQSSMAGHYMVVGGFDSNLQVTLASPTIPYFGSTTVTVKTLPVAGPLHHATGTVLLYLDGSNLLATLTLGGAGNGYAAAFYYLPILNAGNHSLSAVYGGDAYNPAGTSAPAMLQVTPAPVTLSAFCLPPIVTFGANYSCQVAASQFLAGSPETVTYQLDNATPVSVPLVNGAGAFTLASPALGQHQIVVSFPAQGNFAAATPITESFSVQSAP